MGKALSKVRVKVVWSDGASNNSFGRAILQVSIFVGSDPGADEVFAIGEFLQAVKRLRDSFPLPNDQEGRPQWRHKGRPFG